MRILFIEPSYSPRSLGFLEWLRPESLAIESIAGTLSRHHDVMFLDMRIDPDLEGFLRNCRPHIVAVTAYATQVYIAQAVLRKAKEICPDTTTVIGGLHATLCPQDFFDECVDIIVLGEGEYTFREIVLSKESGTRLVAVKGILYKEDGNFLRTDPRPLIENLDDIPFPARNLSEGYKGKYTIFPGGNLASVYTSRGCKNACKFCSVWIVNKRRYRTKSPQKVYEEVVGIGEDNIFVVDDDFFADASRSEEIYRLIKKDGKKFNEIIIQTGVESVIKHPRLVELWRQLCDHFVVFVGFESFEDEELAFLRKNVRAHKNTDCIEILRQNDAQIFGAFIVDPQYDHEDFERLNCHLDDSRISFGQFTVLTPLPGTPFYKEKEKELVIRNYELFDCQHSVLPTRLPREEFYTRFAQLYKNLKNRRRVPESMRRDISKQLGHIDYELWTRYRAMLKKISDPRSYLDTEKGFLSGNREMD